MDNDNNEHRQVIPLDGSYGAGADCSVTIVTKTEDGRQREVEYTVPYLCLDTKRLNAICDMNLILGYKIVKGDARSAGLRELGI